MTYNTLSHIHKLLVLEEERTKHAKEKAKIEMHWAKRGDINSDKDVAVCAKANSAFETALHDWSDARSALSDFEETNWHN